ncbi:MAG: hypothetical protein CMP11_02020 [Zetaproteobacteria bacterium]|nr:hypothetical protein [Pseudobdellovibrionaceae bacterium]
MFFAFIANMFWCRAYLSHIKNFFFLNSTQRGLSTFVVVILFFLVVLSSVMLSLRPRFNLEFDLTRENIHALSEKTVQTISLVRSKQQEVKITGFFSNAEVENKFRSLIKKYQTKGLHINVEYLDPDVNVLKAKSQKIDAANLAIVELNQKKSKLYFFDEGNLTKTILQSLRKRKKNIYYIKGHDELDPEDQSARGSSFFAESIKESGFQLKETRLSRLNDQEKPDLILLLGPKYNLEFRENKEIKKYLDQGGSLLLAYDSFTPVDSINRLLVPFGLSFANDFIFLSKKDPRTKILGQNTAILNHFARFHPLTEDISKDKYFQIYTYDSRSIITQEENTQKMHVNSLVKTKEENIFIDQISSLEEMKSLDEKQIKIANKTIVASSIGIWNTFKDEIKSDKTQETRILALGSSSLFQNRLFSKEANRNFVLNIVNYLTKEEDFIIDTKGKESIGSIEISSSKSVYTILVICFLYPFLYLFSGLYIHNRRQKK